MERVSHADAIKEFLIRETSDRWSTGESFLNGSDRYYWVPDESDIPEILAACPIAHQGASNGAFDCDDYAIALKSKLSYYSIRNANKTDKLPIAAGLFWGRCSWNNDDEHAANWFITRSDRLVWVEPQFNNKKFREAGEEPIRPINDSVSYLRLILY